MCGFLITVNTLNQSSINADKIAHRGPDKIKFWSSPTGEIPVTAVFARLSIIDVSVNGDQPFFSSDGQSVFVFNGELYNHKELRSYLTAKGEKFDGTSDSEVFFKGLLNEGDDFLLKCRGMWAYCLWDRQTEVLRFGRDRFGEKPLYFYKPKSGGIVFASESKGLVPFLDKKLKHERISHFFRNPFDYEHTENTIYKHIRRVPHSHTGTYAGGEIKFRRWWCTLDHLVKVPMNYSDQVERFRELFLDSVKIRLVQDVRISAALSGGLDSSSVICAAHYLYGGKLSELSEKQKITEAYCSHYPGNSQDETYWAEIVAKFLDIDLNKVELKVGENSLGVEEAIQCVEDPYITLPIPMMETYLNIKKDGYSVSLDGHGADELFSGYNDLYLMHLNSGDLSSSQILAIQNSLISGKWDSDINLFDTGKAKSLAFLKYQAKRVRSAVWSDYSRRNQDFQHPNYKNMSLFSKRLYTIFHISILPTLLRNYDRYSMASGVEIRMPFLDHDLVNYVFSLPDSSKVGNGYTKRILRDAMKGIVPDEILQRKDKMGWNAPLHDWLKGPLKIEISKLLAKQNGKIAAQARNNWISFTKLENPTFLDGQKVWALIQPTIWEAVMNFDSEV